MIFVIDTHLLVWSFVGGYRLPTDVKKQIDRVRRSGGRLLVPTIVLSEAPYIAENERDASAGQQEVVLDFETLYDRVVGDPGFEIVGFGQGGLEEAMAITSVPELDDRIIAVTVRFCGADIATEGPEIESSKG